VKHELTEEIKHMLEQKCASRSLDDAADLEAVLKVINSVIERWIDNRCPGCR
jgi:hypothetical protein